MANESEIERLRAEVRKRHAAAGAKISRVRKKGIELGGTSFDIRRDIAKVKRYNMQQLNKYLYELVGFTDKSTQFKAGSAGNPLPSAKWQMYKDLESRYNAKVKSNLASVGDIHDPRAGMTIAERERDMLQKRHRSAQGDIVNRPLYEINREPQRIHDAQSLDTLIADMRHRLSKKFVPSRVRKTKESFVKILEIAGQGDKVAALKKLTLKQLDVLFNYTNFARAVVQIYPSDSEGADDDAGGDNIATVLEWARTKVPRT